MLSDTAIRDSSVNPDRIKFNGLVSGYQDQVHTGGSETTVWPNSVEAVEVVTQPVQ